MSLYCRHCGPRSVQVALISTTVSSPALSVPCTPSPHDTPNRPQDKHVCVVAKYMDHLFARVGSINDIEGRGDVRLITEMLHRHESPSPSSLLH